MPETLDASGLLEETVAAHSFVHSSEGDGWTEPRVESYDCTCGHSHYGFWAQQDPQLTGRAEMHADVERFRALHATHLAGALAEVLESAWDAGHAVGTEQANRPTRIDLAGDRNPYRRSGPPPEVSQAIQYPRTGE